MEKFEKYIEDPHFIDWVFSPNQETEKWFENHIQLHPADQAEMIKLRKELRLLSFPPEMMGEERKDELFRKTLTAMLRSRNTSPIVKLPVQWMKYAAVAVVLLAVASLVYVQQRATSFDLKITEDIFLKNANQNPTLFLPDGTRHAISGDEAQFDFSDPDAIGVNGKIIGKKHGESTKNPEVLVVPFGKKARIILSDGSRIWVNAGSRLIFPGNFEAKKREVYLIGEAYFEVNHQPKKPFLVRTSTVTVKVLGTSFNVSSYPDDDFVSAVLKEGKIQMERNETGWFGSPVELIPNQMAVYRKDGEQIEVRQTNHELYTIWKDGILQFENEEINALITKVERFYNISLELKNPSTGKERIKGKLDLNVGMNEVLEYISKVSHTELKKINAVEYILE